MVGAAVGEALGEAVGVLVGAGVKPMAGQPVDCTHDAQLPVLSM